MIKKDEVPKAIAEIPKTVDQAYTAILDKSQDPEAARKLLHIVLAAARPLSLEEINVAMNVDDEHGSMDSLELKHKLYPADECQSTIKTMCGLFLSIVDSRVHLIHQTAREFLLQKEIALPAPHRILSLGNWKESFDIACSNLTLAKSCIAYIFLDDFGRKDWIPKSLGEYYGREHLYKRYFDGEKAALSEHLSGCYFLDYVAQHWNAHLTKVGHLQDPTLVEKIAFKLYDTRSPRLTYWFLIYGQFNGKSFIVGGSNLTIASFFGHGAVVRLRLEKSANVQAKDYYGDTALHVAGSVGHEAVVQSLLENGADINETNNHGETALHTAVSSNHDSIVRILLNHGADVKINDEDGKPVLHIAIQHQHEAITQLLLEYKADVNEKDHEGRTALHVAAFPKNESIVRLLLENGANIESKAEYERTALHIAVQCENEAIVRLLLENGANVESKDWQEMTALHIAAETHSSSKVELLLQWGACIDVKDNRGMTPLDCAEEEEEVAYKEGEKKQTVRLLKAAAVTSES